MQFSHCFWKPLAERIAAQVEIISFGCNEGNLQKTTAPTHAEAIGRAALLILRRKLLPGIFFLSAAQLLASSYLLLLA